MSSRRAHEVFLIVGYIFLISLFFASYLGIFIIWIALACLLISFVTGLVYLIGEGTLLKLPVRNRVTVFIGVLIPAIQILYSLISIVLPIIQNTASHIIFVISVCILLYITVEKKSRPTPKVKKNLKILLVAMLMCLFLIPIITKSDWDQELIEYGDNTFWAKIFITLGADPNAKDILGRFSFA
jgi:hypothetical protein